LRASVRKAKWLVPLAALWLVWPAFAGGAGQERSAGMSMPMSRGETAENPHMYMTALRPANPADRERAAQILASLRSAIAPYEDYRVALADGYKIFAPNVPTRRKHFTNWLYAREAQSRFDPAHPTSLLYDRTSDGGWKLVGAMYTAPAWFTEDQLSERVPLSVARWHKHVNLCFPPRGERGRAEWKKFGFAGSIATERACGQAGGRWVPELFGWMVHVYPIETDPAKIWAH
jgi:hypothetical protein